MLAADSNSSPKTGICVHHSMQPIDLVGATQLFRCSECSLIRREITPQDLVPEELYSDYYLKNQLVTRFRFGLEFLLSSFRLFRAFKLWTIAPKAKTILDIGCGRGMTLYFLKKFFGFSKTVGTQPSEAAQQFARNALGLEVYREDLIELNLPAKSFEIISFVHVLEHLPYPEKYLAECKRLLAEGGSLIIEVPNYDAWSRKLSGKSWLGYDFKNHISFFQPQSLIFLLAQAGFTTTLQHTFSLEYSTFISTQGLVSRIRGTDNQLFNWLQGHSTRPGASEFILFTLLAPICFLINIALYYSRYGEVILVRATHKPQLPGI